MPDKAMQRIELALHGVTKVYPGVVALKAVDLAISGGEIVGLIGENGAGKSTLMKVLGGTIAPDGGTIVVDGDRLAALTPTTAASRGIAFVHQELNPFTNLDVAGNVLLGREIHSGPFRTLDRRAMSQRVRPILERLGARFGPDDPVARLSLADQQLVEIARALSMDARLVIFDEPTSSLTLSETRRLLDVMRQLRDEGVAVLFISHRLHEVEETAGRVIVLRDGNNAGELTGSEIRKDRMVRMMIGRDVSQFYDVSHGRAKEPLLELKGLRTREFPDVPVDLTVRAGEILGLAGLVGAGRTELALAAFGVATPAGGEVLIAGERLPPGSVISAIAAGLCLVPENRKEQGLFLDFAIADNIGLPSLAAMARGPFVDRSREMALAEDGRDRLGIRAATLSGAVAELSGGNQQKVVLAKWLAMKPRVMIFDEPTRGIDVGAKAEIYNLMQELADSGVAILMISSDMEEVIGVSDRVAVMSRGAITTILEHSELTEENILRLAVA